MRPLAWRVGLFALLGLALLLAAIIVSTRWFAATESASMRFDSSVFGLQVGAPVVFRGVRIGQVTAFGLAPLGPGGVSVPVTAQFDRALLRELLGPGVGSGEALVPALVARGMIARLAMQSLLTGQLYVELDLDSSRASAARTTAAGSGLPSIPTEPTRLQTLQAQLQGLDLAQIGQDLAALAQSARRMMAGPQPERALAHTADAAQAVERLASRLERELVPLAGTSRETLADARQALQQLGQGASRWVVPRRRRRARRCRWPRPARRCLPNCARRRKSWRWLRPHCVRPRPRIRRCGWVPTVRCRMSRAPRDRCAN